VTGIDDFLKRVASLGRRRYVACKSCGERLDVRPSLPFGEQSLSALSHGYQALDFDR
jgi:hypothetical protein